MTTARRQRYEELIGGVAVRLTTMNAKLLTIFLGLVTVLAHAEPKNELQALYGSNGSLRSTGTSTTYRDGSERITATASGFSPDRLTYRDTSRRICGTA